ncbi:hypothetical protein EI555_002952, partial [Monodon monoceros]
SVLRVPSSAHPLAGEEAVSLGSLRAKALLTENVASLGGKTVPDHTQMNELQRRHLGGPGPGRARLPEQAVWATGAQGGAGVPAALSLPHENAKNEEMLKGLRYVQPDGGLELDLRLLAKGEGNGVQVHRLFASARRYARTRRRLELPEAPGGPGLCAVHTYSRRFLTLDLEAAIEALLPQGPPQCPGRPSYPCCLAVTALLSGDLIREGVSPKPAWRNA